MSQEEDGVSSSVSAFSDPQADSALTGMTTRPQDSQSIRYRIQEELSSLLDGLPEALKEAASTTITTVKEKPDEVLIMSALYLYTAYQINSSGPRAGALSSLDLRLGPTLAAEMCQRLRSLRMGGATDSAAVGEETPGTSRSKTIDWLVSNPLYTVLATIFVDQGLGGRFPAVTAAVCYAFGSDTVSVVRQVFPSLPSVDLDFWSPLLKRYEETKKHFADAEALNPRKPTTAGTSKAAIRRMLKAETGSVSGASPVADTETNPEKRSERNDSVASDTVPADSQGTQPAPMPTKRLGKRR